MIIRILEFLLMSGVLYGVFNWAYRAWKAADVKEQVDDIEQVEENYNLVQKTLNDHKDIKEKKDAINKFKNQ